MSVAALPACTVCLRGREACEWCENVSEQDWQAMCDCGLYDFGAHLVDCESRSEHKYVIACDYDSAALPRTANSQPGERVEPREGVLTVYDHEGRYVGCIGAETWQDLIAREAAISQEREA